jgi:hypothetical protein
MFKLTKLITAAEGADRSKLEAALNDAAKAGVVRAMLNPTLPGVYNGGDYIWHLQFNDEAAYRAWLGDAAGGKAIDAVIADPSLVRLAESAAYEGGRSGSKPEGLNKGAYRTLFLSANTAPNAAAVEKFDAETYMMGVYIHTIKNW